ncbi:MAG TPA: aldo/keto reductase [Acidimicrobiales bacterium]|nr:aldo/keto reductase [Acidimicrobiales bacterium]
MDYVTLGDTGLQVSRICLGCMSYGEPARGMQPWSLPADEARPFFRQALDLGINFFDTANVYSAGSSEEITGAALLSMVGRDDVVIATKVNGRMRPGPNGQGLSRRAIMTEIDHSLKRLGVDYVDLYQIHRWDYETPIEETLEALHDVVRAGKARYIGASSMHAWQFAQALYLADLNGWTRFVSMQNHYNLLYREEEREMMPLCVDQGVGAIPWSPLARGRLARPWDTETARSERDEFGRALYTDDDRPVVDALLEVAAERGVPPAQVALAWLLAQDGVVSPIVGATKPHHLEDAAAATSIELTPDEVERLEAPYRPHGVLGFLPARGTLGARNWPWRTSRG